MTAEPDWYADHLAAFAGRPSRERSRPLPARHWTSWWSGQQSCDDPVLAIASQHGFVLSSRQLSALGVTRSTARHAIRIGRWQSPMRGFVGVVDVGSDDASERRRARRRHALHACAAARSRPGLVVSGRSAAILHGLPTVGIPAHPELTEHHGPNHSLRGSAHVYPAAVARDATTTWFGVPVTTVARTVVDVARHGRDDGIAAADAALREGLVTVVGLTAELQAARRWPGVIRAREIVELADPRSESLLESVLRLRMHDDHFPAPQLQYEIGGYFTDLTLVEHGLVLEADGRVKYDGQSDDDPLWREKQRETAIRREGWWVERTLYSDLFRGWPATSRRLREQLRPGFRPRTRTTWW